MEPQQPPIIARTATGGGVAFSREERERYVYLVGKSGSGKSTALFNLAMHDIYAGEGVAVIDPHGDLAEAIIDAMPPERTHEVCYLNVADTEFPVGFNPLAGISPSTMLHGCSIDWSRLVQPHRCQSPHASIKRAAVRSNGVASSKQRSNLGHCK